ncbi:hypothetical protein [Aliikangiella maris]|uniref:Uncharacterized protein n=1 Tax=Aliikangiella maris TaxID=3162458 RepID=A0ABV2C0F7_9GAMM
MDKLIRAIEEALFTLPDFYWLYPLNMAQAFLSGIDAVLFWSIYFVLAATALLKLKSSAFKFWIVVIFLLPGGFAMGGFSAGPWAFMTASAIYNQDLHNTTMNMTYLISNIVVCIIFVSLFKLYKSRKPVKNV